jgi:ubiquinol-cytochrome c reductase cytochrome c subunit
MRKIVLGAALALVSTLAAAAEFTPPKGDARAGLATYNKYGCYSCHGIVGQGTLRDGPRLNAAALGYPALLTQLRTPRYEMPAYTEVQISDQAVADIFAYLSDLPKPPDPKTIGALQ